MEPHREFLELLSRRAPTVADERRLGVLQCQLRLSNQQRAEIADSVARLGVEAVLRSRQEGIVFRQGLRRVETALERNRYGVG